MNCCRIGLCYEIVVIWISCQCCLSQFYPQIRCCVYKCWNVNKWNIGFYVESQCYSEIVWIQCQSWLQWCICDHVLIVTHSSVSPLTELTNRIERHQKHYYYQENCKTTTETWTNPPFSIESQLRCSPEEVKIFYNWWATSFLLFLSFGTSVLFIIKNLYIVHIHLPFLAYLVEWPVTTIAVTWLLNILNIFSIGQIFTSFISISNLISWYLIAPPYKQINQNDLFEINQCISLFHVGFVPSSR